MSGELVFDLNALFIYAKVVEHGGFAPAGRVLGIPKSTISRRSRSSRRAWAYAWCSARRGNSR